MASKTHDFPEPFCPAMMIVSPTPEISALSIPRKFEIVSVSIFKFPPQRSVGQDVCIY